LVAVVVVAAVGLTGAGAAAAALTEHDSSEAPTSSARSLLVISPAPTGSARSTSAPPVVIASVRPIRLRIPAIEVDAGLEQLATDAHHVLQPPRDPAEAGWYAASAVPGDLGPSVIAGHVDSALGRAVFWRLRELGAGDSITVARSDGRTVAYRVVSMRRYPRDQFPTEDVYGPTPDTALRLITCGGTYDRKARHYRDNVVVFAVAV
jgi:sortase (surface protein transpeptidase)